MHLFIHREQVTVNNTPPDFNFMLKETVKSVTVTQLQALSTQVFNLLFKEIAANMRLSP